MKYRSLRDLVALRKSGQYAGITSVCSANPVVLRAALRNGRTTDTLVLIEATCNQVNHQGGYTGLKPDNFTKMVKDLATLEGCAEDLILLGGDHLGPNPWRNLPAEEAMTEAEHMIKAYVKAGFRKIHLDTSMGCLGEPAALDDYATATRAARLAKVAEATAKACDLPPPLYVIGTEVPPPGGADHLLSSVQPTSSESARRTIEVHRRTFLEEDLAQAFDRVIGIVVQPGVEFGNHNVITYEPSNAKQLVTVLKDNPQFVFEAHSTDYQGLRPLTQLVNDGFVILKVGPELTFVLRETLYALDLIATELLPDYGNRQLFQTMEKLMLNKPSFWSKHYSGDPNSLRVLRHYSLSDRIRYYWHAPEATNAINTLINALTNQVVPAPLMSQHLPDAKHFTDKPCDPEEILLWRVGEQIKRYHSASSLKEDKNVTETISTR